MTLPPFATAQDVADIMGRPLTTEEEELVTEKVADVSAEIRAAAGWQQISFVPVDAVMLRGSGGRTLRLPQRPVTEVASVSDVPTGQWRWGGGETIERLDRGYFDGPVTVTYSHGLTEDSAAYQWARALCRKAVKRVLDQPSETLTSVSIGNYAERHAAGAGMTLLSEAERGEVAAAFGRPVSVVRTL